MEIIQKIVPVERRPKFNLNGHLTEFKMVPEYITIHETANTAKGANDLAHANLQFNGNSRNASWHLQVDEDSCYQSLPFDVAGMHAGDGINGAGNRKSIAIEICVNSDGNYEQAVQNAADLTAQLMNQFNIPIEKVVPHKKWSGKNCPTKLLPRWNEFINMINKELEPMKLFSFYTGGYSSAELVEVHNYIKINKWDFTPERNANGDIMFNVGVFGEGTEAAIRFEDFLKVRGFAYEKKY